MMQWLRELILYLHTRRARRRLLKRLINESPDIATRNGDMPGPEYVNDVFALEDARLLDAIFRSVAVTIV